MFLPDIFSYYLVFWIPLANWVLIIIVLVASLWTVIFKHCFLNLWPGLSICSQKEIFRGYLHGSCIELRTHCFLDLVLREGVVFQLLAVPSYGPPFEWILFTWIHCEDSSYVHAVVEIAWLCAILDFSSTGACRWSAGRCCSVRNIDRYSAVRLTFYQFNYRD